MRRIAIAVMMVLGMFAGYCRAEVFSSSELINNAKAYDGKTVVYTGEAVGEVMARGEYAWINLNDGANALGIWVRKDVVAGILSGNYKSKGDVFEVTGTFHRACVEHGGDLDIHAESVKLIEKGSLTARPVNTTTIKLSAVFFAVLLLVIFYRRPSKPAGAVKP